MDESGPPPTPRRNQSSTASRRPSTQRNKPGPRGRRSTQSLSLSRSNSKPEETPTFTSFEPFSSPKQDDSEDSCSSSKRSRSIYAPNRQNSVDGGQFTRTDDETTTPLPTPKKTASKAAQSLMNTMMDMERTGDSLFNEHDLQYFRYHPSVLAQVDNKSLRELSKKQSYFSMIRTLAGDLAQRDAEVVAMRKRLEDLGKVFKDHLCAEHELSRLEADRTLHNLTLSTRDSAEQTMLRSLEDAADTTFADSPLNPFSDSHVVPQSDGTHSSNASESLSPRHNMNLPTGQNGTQNGAIRGMMSMFGGRGTVRPTKTSKKKETPLVSQLNSAKSSMYHRRKSSIGSAASSKNLIPAPAGPVEMNAIVETEHLPPPLISQRDIQAQYPGYTADVYGFVIDNTRISEFVDKNRFASPAPPRGADTPITSSSSVKSMPHSGDEDSEAPEPAELEPSSWASYLKFDGSALGSLSWLPIASTTSTPSDGGETPESPVEMGHTEAVKVLQQQLADDFARVQKSRTIPWEKFLSQDRTQPDPSSTSYVSSMFRRNTPSAPRPTLPLDIAPQLTSLPPALRAERTRLVLNGIPMSMRSQIYTTLALETLQPDPDEYRALVAASAHSVDPSLLSEIKDDIPRTLPNNVFFRPSHLSTPITAPTTTDSVVPGHARNTSAPDPSTASKGRAALKELLLAFLTRRPEIGYCQGMNLIAGYLLLCLPSTESAFWVFTFLVEHPLGDVYFDATLRGASIEICVLRSFVDELIPRLGRKLDECGVEGRESAPYNWFLTAYASALSVEGVYRVWDVLLGLPGGGGAGWMIRFGLALCKAFEEEMLALEGGFEIRGFMDGMGVGGVGTAGKASGGERRMNGFKSGAAAGERGRKGVSIDGLIKASWKLGAVIKDEEVKKRRKYFALKIDESALG